MQEGDKIGTKRKEPANNCRLKSSKDRDVYHPPLPLS